MQGYFYGSWYPAEFGGVLVNVLWDQEGTTSLLFPSMVRMSALDGSELAFSDVSHESSSSLVSAGSNEPKCYLTGTLLQTPAGLLEVCDLFLGASVIAASGEILQVTHFKVYGPDHWEIVSLRTAQSSLTITASHRVVARRAGKDQTAYASSLSCGDRVVCGIGHVEEVVDVQKEHRFVEAVVEVTFAPDLPVLAYPTPIQSKGFAKKKTRRGGTKCMADLISASAFFCTGC